MVLQNQISQIVAVVFLDSADIGIRHPLACALLQACLIGIYQCPLSITLHMYMASVLGSFFMTLNAFLETPPERVEGRVWRAGGIMVGCFLLGFLVPLHRSAVLERTARENFVREHWQQSRRSEAG